MVLVPPNHPNILYFGRVDCTDSKAPSFAFPGVSIRASFSGADSIDIILNDHGSAGSPNFYEVIIDDSENTARLDISVSGGDTTYNIADGLSTNAVHTVEIFKRVESNGGQGQAEFKGFRIPDGAEILPLSPRPYRMEFIGDSITCGYGNEISVDDPNGYTYHTINSNAYMSWGAIAARDLSAEFMAVAYSGRGVFRNYAGGAGTTLPQMYLDILPDNEASTVWKVSQYIPDVTVINLGTNDFSPGWNGDISDLVTNYENAMLDFVETLREYYPATFIILAVGTMVGDSYPSGYNAKTNILNSLEAIVNTRTAEGDTRLRVLDLGTQSAPYGEDWHPTIQTHMNMAGALADLIDSLDLL